jgi:hypothetical protein
VRPIAKSCAASLTRSSNPRFPVACSSSFTPPISALTNRHATSNLELPRTPRNNDHTTAHTRCITMHVSPKSPHHDRHRLARSAKRTELGGLRARRFGDPHVTERVRSRHRLAVVHPTRAADSRQPVAGRRSAGLVDSPVSTHRCSPDASSGARVQSRSSVLATTCRPQHRSARRTGRRSGNAVMRFGYTCAVVTLTIRAL